MKVVHLCLACFYADNYAYQENILPKYHQKIGYDVEVIASQVSFDSNGNQCMVEPSQQYINEFGIKVVRLPYSTPKIFSVIVRKYKGTYDAICKAKPDILFVHGPQFIDMLQVIRYAKYHNNIRIYIDNHADFINSAQSWISKGILHGILWRCIAQLALPYATKFYGVLPARVDFLREVYGLPDTKIGLLVMGADDEMVQLARQEDIKLKTRAELGIEKGTFVVCTGGRIDKGKKEVLCLIKAIEEFKEPNVRLIIFGSVSADMKKEFMSEITGNRITYIGWVDSSQVYRYFAISNLVVFPSKHSVLWEQAVGTGVPCIFRDWPGMKHVDVGGNCLFIGDGSVKQIAMAIERCFYDKELYDHMKDAATNRGIRLFSYSSIARRSIEG